MKFRIAHIGNLRSFAYYHGIKMLCRGFSMSWLTSHKDDLMMSQCWSMGYTEERRRLREV
jgi:hypothetical protein